MKYKFGVSHEGMHVDQHLTQIALDYRPDGLIADMVMPVVEVGKQSDTYTIFSRADALRIVDTQRAPDTEAKRVRRSVSSDTYYCKNYALQYPTTIEEKANADPIYLQKLVNGGVEYVLDKIYLGWESRAATLLTTTTNVGSSAAVSSGWTDIDNSDCLGDCNTALDNVLDSTGKKANRAVFGESAWRNFRRNTSIRNLIYGVDNGGGWVSRKQAAEVLEVEELLVGEAFQNTGNENQAEVLSQIWGDNVVFSYIPKSPSRDAPSGAYTFRWTAQGLAQLGVERHAYDTKRKSESVETGLYQDEKITGAEYIFVLTAVNSST